MTNERDNAIAAHYSGGGLGDRILAGLRQAGIDPTQVRPADLAPVDEFHMGGRAATQYITSLMHLSPGMHVLDIGCGWGGMALTLAQDYGCRVTGITLSMNQLATARARVAAAGLSDRIHLMLQDYRHTEGQFDRIVSVGMLEHVGVPNFDTYFSCIKNLLHPDGVALVHTIGKPSPPQAHSPWINKYIFPFREK